MTIVRNGVMNRYKFLMTEFPEFIKNTELGLCLINRDFEIVWMNKTQSKWFGPLKDICGKRCYDVFEHNPKICEGCPALRTFQNAKPYSSECRIGYTRNGRIRFYELSTAPIKDRKGEVVEVLKIVKDVTRRKMLEKKTGDQERQLVENSKHLKFLNKSLWLTNKIIRKNASKLREANEKIKFLNKSLEEKVRQRTKRLQAANEELLTLYTLGKKMVSTLNPGEVLDMIVKTVSMLMEVEATSVRLFDERKKFLVLRAAYGMSYNYEEKCKFMKPTPEMDRFIENKAPYLIKSLSDIGSVPFKSELLREGFRSFVVIPIIFNNEVLGSINMFFRKSRIFLDREVHLLQAFASQAAIAIKNASLHEKVHLSHYNTINTLSLATEARDPYTRGHSERVTNYALGIARILNFTKDDLDTLKYAGRIHDIGKIAISDLILLKPGRLTPAERAQVELHTIKGVEIISNLKFLEEGVPIIKHHHEKYDGTGYPDGLKSVEIPLGARILAVADAFDAMTSERPYRNALTFEEAVDDLRRNSGRQFDPKIVGAFLEALTKNLPK